MKPFVAVLVKGLSYQVGGIAFSKDEPIPVSEDLANRLKRNKQFKVLTREQFAALNYKSPSPPIGGVIYIADLGTAINPSYKSKLTTRRD